MIWMRIQKDGKRGRQRKEYCSSEWSSSRDEVPVSVAHEMMVMMMSHHEVLAGCEGRQAQRLTVLMYYEMSYEWFVTSSVQPTESLRRRYSQEVTAAHLLLSFMSGVGSLRTIIIRIAKNITIIIIMMAGEEMFIMKKRRKERIRKQKRESESERGEKGATE